MLPYRLLSIPLIVLLLLMAHPVGWAADVLKNVPASALGFVVIRHLEGTDAHVERVFKTLQVPFLGPLAFLRATTGIAKGLDIDGDLLLAVLPGEKPTAQPLFAVWLPVMDYEAFITSLHGTTADPVAAVTVAGEDLLVARHGDWALVMDPDQRARMKQILGGETQPTHSLSAWEKWLGTNDITLIVLPDGVRSMWNWSVPSENADGSMAGGSEDRRNDDLSAPIDEEYPLGKPAVDGIAKNGQWSAWRPMIRSAIQEMPALVQGLAEARAIACSLRLDDAGNAFAGLRVAWQQDVLPIPSTWAVEQDKASLPSLNQPGGFIVSGAGRLPSPILVAASGSYARLFIRDLEKENKTNVDERAAAQFVKAVELAASHVGAAAVLGQPGEKQDAVYSNRYSLIRVDSADAFLEQVREVMRLWNEVNHEMQGEVRLVFDSRTVLVGNRDATEYSIDMVAAVGAPGLPEVRQAMEKLFGPEGKLRLFLVPGNDHAVLLAVGTLEQAAGALELATLDQGSRWNQEGLDPTSRLLPERADWRLFFSAHGYTHWLKRQMDAVLGPVIGGPIVDEFPSSPPIGAAGGFEAAEFWADVVVPAATIESTAMFLKKR